MTAHDEVGAHAGEPLGKSHRAMAWSSALTVTTDDQVFVRGVALDEAIGRDSLAATVLRLWRGSAGAEDEVALLDACLVASIDHGPLSPSTLVTRTIASTRAAPMSALAGGILTFGELHGAVVSRGMQILADAPSSGPLDAWADHVFESERAADRRIPGVGHRWHHRDLRAERLLELAGRVSGGRQEEAVRALADRVSQHTGSPAPVNVDGALAVALTALRLNPAYGDFLFAISRSFGLAAHFVEEQTRERPMRTIDPTAARYDGEPVERGSAEEADS